MRIIKKTFLSLLIVAFTTAVSLAVYYYVNKSPQLFLPSVAGLNLPSKRVIDPESTRETTNGKVTGFADTYQTQAWLNIPYAQPPIADLRWRAPQPPADWLGTRQGLNYGSPCVQFWGVLAGTTGTAGELLGSEDCLSLNIWAPRQTRKQAAEKQQLLPVMFWIHGGGNDSGTANLYQAHHLAGTQDVVVVLINYRLGLMGWFSHPTIRELAPSLADASGNFGTLDLIAGLHWVQKNIAQFGGDPNNVTIFGESAGGRNVFSLMASPLATGLFHKAISQSGSTDTTLLTLAEEFSDDKEKKTIAGLKNSSNGVIELVLREQFPSDSQAQLRERIKSTPSDELLGTLRSVDAKKLMQLASDNLREPGYTRIARVIRDGYVIPKQSVLSLFQEPARYNAVPLILGTTRDEQKVFMARNPEYVSYLFGVLPRIKDEVRYNRVAEYVSINWKAGAVDEPAKLISATSAPPVYAYRFDWDEAPVNFLADLATLLGASHGFEISFVFGDFEGGVPLEFLQSKQNAQGRTELSLAMMDYWGNFAHTGNPSAGRSGQRKVWQPWRHYGENILLLDTQQDGGIRMADVRTNVADIKAQIPSDNVFTSQKERCEAYAVLFLHGYQTSDFFDPQEYLDLGCAEYPVGMFRDS